MSLFSPFAGTYRGLGLEARWWHRLAVVGLSVCMLAAFAGTLASTLWPDVHDRNATIKLKQDIAASEQEHDSGPWQQYTQIASLPPLPKGFHAVVVLSGNGERLEFPPDMTLNQMTKTLCEHVKRNDATCWQVVSERPAKQLGQYSAADIAVPSLWRLAVQDIAIALAVALAVDYLLQLAYRAGLFVVYGKPTSAPAAVGI